MREDRLKSLYCMIPFIEHSGKSKSVGSKSRSMVASAKVCTGKERTINEHKRTSRDDRMLFILMAEETGYLTVCVSEFIKCSL